MDPDYETEIRCKAYDVGNGDLVICEDGNPEGWIRSDTTVSLVDADPTEFDGTKPARD